MDGAPLLLPDGLSAAAVAELLAADLTLAAARATATEQAYWDTFDGRLHAAGLVLVAAGGRLALADAATLRELAGARRPDTAPQAARVLLADVPDGELRERLAPLIEMRALTPIARVHLRTRAIDVLDARDKIVVRLRVEEPVALLAGGARIALPARIHVTPVRGFDADCERVRALLGRLGCRAPGRALHDDAVAAAGGRVGGSSAKARVKLRPGMRTDAAAATILLRLEQVVEDNLPGTLADVDSEFLHDLRVAVRRSRAMQRELRGAFAPEPLRVFRAGFKELQQVTGAVRDLDVQLLEFDALAGGLPSHVAADVAPLRALLEQRRAAERRAMVRALRARRTRGLLDSWVELLGGLVDAPEHDRPDAARPIGEVAGRRIRTVYRQMVRMGAAIDDDSPHEALHDLRKKGKELRYLLEFFAALYPDDVVKPMVATLKGLQDVLGRFQDREVQADQLRGLGDEVVARDGGAAALMAIGVLVQRLGEEQAQARAEFERSFARFAARAQRKLVARTFADASR